MCAVALYFEELLVKTGIYQYTLCIIIIIIYNYIL